MLPRELARSARDYAYRLIHWHRQCVTVKGVKLVLRDPAISPRMFYILCQGYETKEANLAERYLGSGDRVLEIGGGVGFLALICMNRIGIKDYWLVEGNPALVPIIRKNLALNHLDDARIGIRNAALAERDGVVTFHVQREFWSSSAIARPGSVGQAEVAARTLPAIVAEMPFRPNVLIMDIEGGEASVDPRSLAGFDKILMEFHPKIVGHQKIEALISTLIGIGFESPERGVFLRPQPH